MDDQSSSDNELPEIPGTRFPWLRDDLETADGAGPSNSVAR